VVAELQQRRAKVARRGAEPGFALRLEIAGKEQTAPGQLDAHHERGVVPRGKPCDARWPERIHGDVADPKPRLPRRTLRDRDAPRACEREERFEGGLGPAARGNPEPGDRQGAEHGDEAPAVVEVRVARDHEVEAVHAERAEGREHDPLAGVETGPAARPEQRRAAVDQHRGAVALHDRGIPLADVEIDDARDGGIEARRRTPGGGGRGERGQRQPDAGATRAHAGERERARSNEPERTGHHPQTRGGDRGDRAAAVEHRVAEPCRERERRGEGTSRLRSARGDKTRCESDRQQRERGERHGHRVREPAERRDHAEVAGDERRGGGRGARGGPEHERERAAGVLESALGRRAFAAGRRRAPHERRRGEERELHTWGEARGGIPRRDRERGGAEQVRGRERPPRELAQGEEPEEHERALDRWVEPGQERVRGGTGERGREGEAPRVEAPGERRRAPRQRGRREVERARHQPQVETGDRHEMREAEPREGRARRRAERLCLAEPERREEAAAGPLGREPAGAGAAEAREGIAPGPTCRPELRVQLRLERRRARAEAAPRESVRTVAAAGVATSTRRRHAQRRPDPAPRPSLGELRRVGRPDQERIRKDETARPERDDVPQLERRTAHGGRDPRLDARLDRPFDGHRPRGLESVRERERAGGEGHEHGAHGAGASRRHPERRTVEGEP